jgi:hypothetical protein
MSMGFLVDEETPMIWRGPMVMSALTQMLREVEWGARRARRRYAARHRRRPAHHGAAVPLAGAVIVSTPQDLALIDARKGLNMFRKVDVPLLGIVENMSYFVLSRYRQALRHLRPWRRKARGRAARRHVLGRGAAADGDPRDIGFRRAGRCVEARRPGSGDLQGDRRKGPGADQRGSRQRRGRACYHIRLAVGWRRRTVSRLH